MPQVCRSRLHEPGVTLLPSQDAPPHGRVLLTKSCKLFYFTRNATLSFGYWRPPEHGLWSTAWRTLDFSCQSLTWLQQAARTQSALCPVLVEEARTHSRCPFKFYKLRTAWCAETGPASFARALQGGRTAPRLIRRRRPASYVGLCSKRVTWARDAATAQAPQKTCPVPRALGPRRASVHSRDPGSAARRVTAQDPPPVSGY